MSELEEKVKSFSNSPGVYLMKDASGQIIYIGKAINLQKRVLSYFNEGEQRYQISFLMKRVVDVSCLITDSPKEALLLENTLIKKHKPRYNIQLRDDKTYVSLKLSVHDRFPRLYVTRQIKKDGSLYFGPYPSAESARKTSDFLEKYFRLRTCSDHELANRVRPCLQYQIHRCEAPCTGLINEENYQYLVDQVQLFLKGKKGNLLKILEKEMQKQSEQEKFEKAAITRDLVLSLRQTLEKQKVERHQWVDQDVLSYYREGERITFCVLLIREGKMWESRLFHLSGHGEEEEMIESFLNQFYKEDQFLPDEILIPCPLSSLELLEQILSERKASRKVRSVRILVPKRGDRSDLIHLAFQNAREGFRQRFQKEEEKKETLAKLQTALHLQNFPQRMECVDISNLSGEKAVGSMVVFQEGVPDKKNYRKFRIQTIHQPNDFAMMKEVLKRRLFRLRKENSEGWNKPDLLILDGGKGQLNAVSAIFEELNITGIDLMALAKEKEGGDKVFLLGRKNPVLLGKNSKTLLLLMQIRDEAHRFAITYHKKLREKSFLPS